MDIEILEDSGLWSWRGSTSKEIELKNLAPLYLYAVRSKMYAYKKHI